jgi:acyl-CoA synthetase (AMP-forming)/AMP-acid ligase II
MLNFAGSLDHNVARHPDKVVLVQGTRRLTYRSVYYRVNAVAAALRGLGVGTGDVVALLLSNCTEFIELAYAVNRIGAAFLPLNCRLAPAEWWYVLQNSRARVLVAQAEYQARVDGIPEPLPDLRHRMLIGGSAAGQWTGFEAALSAHMGQTVPVVDVPGESMHRLVYTSGTTSRPKGVCITHRNVLWKTFAHIAELGVTERDSTLVCGPLYHVGAFDVPALDTLFVGGSLIIMPKFDAAEAARTIHEERPTNTWLAPVMISSIIALPDFAEYDTSSLKLIAFGGEKTPKPLVEKFIGAFPGTWLSDSYGMTETVSADTFNDAASALTKVGSVGRPVRHLEVRIIGADGAPAAPGKLGEIALRGPQVFPGYWRDEAATAAAFLADGWFLTGDIGLLDEDGYLYIEDRKKDMIVSGGENIATPEVERVLYEHPDVAEAAVIGVPHTRWGQVPKAFVVLRDGATSDEAGLREFCLARLAKFKVPQAFEFLDALPRTPTGKVLKRALRG